MVNSNETCMLTRKFTFDNKVDSQNNFANSLNGVENEPKRKDDKKFKSLRSTHVFLLAILFVLFQNGYTYENGVQGRNEGSRQLGYSKFFKEGDKDNNNVKTDRTDDPDEGEKRRSHHRGSRNQMRHREEYTRDMDSYDPANRGASASMQRDIENSRRRNRNRDMEMDMDEEKGARRRNRNRDMEMDMDEEKDRRRNRNRDMEMDMDEEKGARRRNRDRDMERDMDEEKGGRRRNRDRDMERDMDEEKGARRRNRDRDMERDMDEEKGGRRRNRDRDMERDMDEEKGRRRNRNRGGIDGDVDGEDGRGMDQDRRKNKNREMNMEEMPRELGREVGRIMEGGMNRDRRRNDDIEREDGRDMSGDRKMRKGRDMDELRKRGMDEDMERGKKRNKNMEMNDPMMDKNNKCMDKNPKSPKNAMSAEADVKSLEGLNISDLKFNVSEAEIAQLIDKLEEYVKFNDMFILFNYVNNNEKTKYIKMQLSILRLCENLSKTYKVPHYYKTRQWSKAFQGMSDQLLHNERKSYNKLCSFLQNGNSSHIAFVEFLNELIGIWTSFTKEMEKYWKEYLTNKIKVYWDNTNVEM
ncbi:Phist protein [Plasmodium gonderi]|uniref:Phist protein n=1 Tax=Plasmodium gonderi TaxID=77519 RepID=A0A1Y1JGN9_PLAGO|nr:Phist protein [Plasmodium gonderi]GAW79603.1 Phist protein [Plasmodium gonderi]